MTDSPDGPLDDEPVRRKHSAIAPLAGALVVLDLVVVGAYFLTRGPHEAPRVRQRLPPPVKVTAHPIDLPSTPPPTPKPTSPPKPSPTRATRTSKPTPPPPAKPTRHPTHSTPRPTPTPPPRPPTSPPHPTPPQPPPTTSPPPPTSSSEARQILQLTNRERANAGCAPLRLNTALNRAAQAHADDMVENHYFAHNSPNGRTPAARMRAAGYPRTPTAENLASGSRNPAAVVTAWMNSTPERQNILNCSFTTLGVGYNPHRIKRNWNPGTWVQNLGT